VSFTKAFFIKQDRSHFFVVIGLNLLSSSSTKIEQKVHQSLPDFVLAAILLFIEKVGFDRRGGGCGRKSFLAITSGGQFVCFEEAQILPTAESE